MIIKTDRKAAISKLGMGDLLIVSIILNGKKYGKKIFALTRKENNEYILVSLIKGEENIEYSSKTALIEATFDKFSNDDIKIVKYEDYQIEGNIDNQKLELKDIVRDTKNNKFYVVDIVDGQYCLLSFSYDLGDKQIFGHSSLEALNKHFNEQTYRFGLEKLNYDDLNLILNS